MIVVVQSVFNVLLLYASKCVCGDFIFEKNFSRAILNPMEGDDPTPTSMACDRAPKRAHYECFMQTVLHALRLPLVNTGWLRA